MSAPHDPPSVAELLAAVRDLIEQDLSPALEGRLRFHARVAANALGIVSRELALGPAQEAAHRERLTALGFATDAELAAAIRSGTLDERYEEVARAVREAVREKLAVANPSYAEQDGA